MRSRRVISLLMVVMICFSFSSCKDSGAVSSSNERGVSSKQRGVVETKEEIRKTDMMTTFCEYVEKNFPEVNEKYLKGLWVYTKDEDYSDDDDYLSTCYFVSLPDRVIPHPFPNKTAHFIHTIGDSSYDYGSWYDISVSEYESTGEAKSAFEAIISPDQSVIDTSDRNDNSYFFNGKNEGFFCIGVQGNDMAMKLIGDRADEVERVFKTNRSEFNLLAGVGIYLKNNYIVIVEMDDLVFKDKPTHSETLDKCLKLFDELGIKNPLSAGTDYDKVISYFDSVPYSPEKHIHVYPHKMSIDIWIANREIENEMS